MDKDIIFLLCMVIFGITLIVLKVVRDNRIKSLHRNAYITELAENFDLKGMKDNELEGLFFATVHEQAKRGLIVKPNNRLDEKTEKELAELRELVELSKAQRVTGELVKMAVQSMNVPVFAKSNGRIIYSNSVFRDMTKTERDLASWTYRSLRVDEVEHIIGWLDAE